ncbi:MAG: ABC transporter permease, partial [Candidatus Bathyarchaeia archaeon]
MRVMSLRVKARGLVSLAAAAALWQVLADFLVRNSFILPSFLDVAKAYTRLAETVLLQDLAVSLMHFALGLAMGLIVGVP